MRAGLEEAWALPSLTADAARADPATRAVYESELRRVAAVLADGLPGPDAEARAWALLAVGAGMARAVTDEGVKEEILAAVQQAAARLQRLLRDVDHALTRRLPKAQAAGSSDDRATGTSADSARQRPATSTAGLRAPISGPDTMTNER